MSRVAFVLVLFDEKRQRDYTYIDREVENRVDG